MHSKCIICNLKYPNFNYKDEQKALYCASCKLDDMIDVKHKRCITCDLRQPTYNYPSEENALYCNDCKHCGMIDIKHKHLSYVI